MRCVYASTARSRCVERRCVRLRGAAAERAVRTASQMGDLILSGDRISWTEKRAAGAGTNVAIPLAEIASVKKGARSNRQAKGAGRAPLLNAELKIMMRDGTSHLLDFTRGDRVRALHRVPIAQHL